MPVNSAVVKYCLWGVFILAFAAGREVFAQSSKTVFMVETAASAADAMRVGKSINCEVGSFVPLTRYFENASSKSVILANNGALVTVFDSFPNARWMACNLYRIERDSRYGIADMYGNVIVDPKYRDLWVVHSEYGGLKRQFLWVSVPNPGIAQRGGYRDTYQQLIDIRTGETLNHEALYGISLASFLEAMPEGSDGFFAVQPVAADGPQGYMSVLNGNVAIPAVFYQARPFKSHRAIVGVTYEHAQSLCQGKLPEHVRAGCKRAHLVGPQCNSNVVPYDVAACQTDQDERRYYGYGVIDSSGAFVSRFDYDWIGDYSGNVAIFRRVPWYSEELESFGYLDLDGHEILTGLVQAEPYDAATQTMTAQYRDPKSEIYYWSRFDAYGNMRSRGIEHPDSDVHQEYEVIREPFLSPFEVQNTESRVQSETLDTYSLRNIVTDDSGERHFFLMVNAWGNVIWPQNWNHPCADSHGILKWPDHACKHQKRLESLRTFLIDSGPARILQVLHPHWYILWSLVLQENILLWGYCIQKGYMQAVADFVPPLEAYAHERSAHYIRVGYGDNANHSLKNPGTYAHGRAYGWYHVQTGKMIFRPGRYKKIVPLFDRLFAFEQNGHIGLMTDQEAVVLEPKFLDVSFEPEKDWLRVVLYQYETPNPDDAEDAQVWDVYRWHDPKTGMRISRNDEMRISQADNSRQVLALNTRSIPTVDKDSIYRVIEVTDSFDEVWDEYLVDANGKLYEPFDPTSEWRHHYHVVTKDTAVVEMIHKNPEEDIMSMTDDMLDFSAEIEPMEGEWVSKEPEPDHILMCLDKKKKSPKWFEFDDGAQFLVGEGIACVRHEFESYYMTCDERILGHVQACTQEFGSRYADGHAWIKPYGEQQFVRVNRSGEPDGMFKLYADHVMYRDGVFRFTTHFPSPTDGWKYVEMVVDRSGKIIWPRDWDDPCHNTFGNVIWPEGSCIK
ncbi:MAG: WG repeat-containing protein [Proteobacteria bacterium]|nr:WG repeat-containing protein [Pseudomonadota bacterium]